MRPVETTSQYVPETFSLISALDDIADNGICSPGSDFGAPAVWWQGRSPRDRQAAVALCGVCPALASCVGYARTVQHATTDMAEGGGLGNWRWSAVVVAGVDVGRGETRTIETLAAEQGAAQVWRSVGVVLGGAFSADFGADLDAAPREVVRQRERREKAVRGVRRFLAETRPDPEHMRLQDYSAWYAALAHTERGDLLSPNHLSAKIGWPSVLAEARAS